jgi:ring-1,2-phenylacetyl-CoA epoxidase subunit PaaE
MDEVFLCGPEEMIFMLKDWLEQQGVEARKIHFELFHTRGGAAGAGSGAAAGSAKVVGRSGGEKISRVTVRLDGISHDFDLPYDGTSMLDAAMMEGVDLPFACKGGVCCTCRARLAEGQVEMEVNYALEADELAAGFILTCPVASAHGQNIRCVHRRL